MEELVNDFFKWAISDGWNISKNKNNINFPDIILKRYYKIKKLNSFMTFLGMISNCSTADDYSWFLCISDYNKENLVNEFSWNVFEKISIDAAANFEERKAITDWWNDHFPIFMSVKDEYSFFAIDLVDNFGYIVQGFEPEFENVVYVAKSFEEFLYLITIGKIKI